jgi:hypothetical protein
MWNSNSALGFGGNTFTTAIQQLQKNMMEQLGECNKYDNRKKSLAGAGTLQAGLAFGGYTTTSVANTEEFTSSINVTTPAAWASGGNMGTARYGLAGAGTQTAGLAFGGYTTTEVANATEEYDGTAWTAGGNLGTARVSLGGAGIQTAGLFLVVIQQVLIQQQQKNMTDQCLDWQVEIWEQLEDFSRLWNSNCWFSFWWIYNNKSITQKNMMVRLGQVEEI